MMPPSETRSIDDGTRDHGVGRRMRLREFQSRLVSRMQAAQSGTDAHTNQLGVLIGATRWLIDLQQAGEIVPVGTITPVPLTQDWFLGVTNIRGNLVSVADLARFHGDAATPVEKDSRIVAFAPALAFNGALLVTRVLGLRNMMQMRESGGATGAVDDGQLWSRVHYVDEDEQVWSQLDLSRAIQDPRFLHVGI